MRICFLIGNLDHGGAQRQLGVLAAGLHQRGHEVAVCVLRPGGPMANDLQSSGVDVVDIARGSSWNLAGLVRRVGKEIEAQRPDVVHGYLEMGNLLAILVRRRTPGAATVLGIRSSCIDNSQYGWSARLMRWGTSRMFSHADLIIANSHTGKADTRASGYPDDRTVVVPNGIDTARFAPCPDSGSHERQSWGVSEHTRVIGIIGRLHPMKDHQTFLAAVKIAVETNPDLRFVCVGDGPEAYMAMLRAMAQQYGVDSKITWQPARKGISAVYNALDILTSSSDSGEGFSNVIGEAMACGIPCVVTDIGDSARIVGEHGKVVPTHSPEALANAWLDVLNLSEQERKNLSLDVRRRIETEFTIAKLVDRTEDALRNITASS